MREHGVRNLIINIKVKRWKIYLLFHMIASYGALFCLILHLECYDEIWFIGIEMTLGFIVLQSVLTNDNVKK